MIIKRYSRASVLKYILLICVLFSANSEAQIAFGLKKLNIWSEFAFASPEKELKNSYSLGEPMKLYLGADLPFAFVKYSSKHNTGLSLAAVLDHEKANFENSSYDPLNAKIT